MRILVVEDDIETSSFVARGLGEAGYRVTTSSDGRDGLFQATGGEFDAIIVDRMLPELDGLALVKALRATGDTTPVLMLTALGGIADRVDGLDAGADDYLIKPFAFAELAARIHALGRRPALRAQPLKVLVGDIELDIYHRTVTRAGRQVLLQPREFALLAELMRNPGRVMTRTMLLERVWDFDFDPKTNIVETHMSRLRAKLNNGFDDDPIKTVRGAGYKISN
jgi:two-component system OmpR family response regulator